MCLDKSCKNHNNSSKPDEYSKTSQCNNSWSWAHCDKTDKYLIYAVLFNLFIYLLLQLKHLGTFGMSKNVCAPGCDSEGNGECDRFKSSPRLVITIRYIDAGTLITKHSKLMSHKFYGSLETYEYLNTLIHDTNIQNRKIILLKTLSNIDTNTSSYSSWLQLYNSIIGNEKQHQEFLFDKFIPPFHISFYEFCFVIFLVIVLIINLQFLKIPMKSLNVNMHSFNSVVEIFIDIVFYVILIGVLLCLTLLIGIMKK
jgi:hypothetical protein